MSIEILTTEKISDQDMMSLEEFRCSLGKLAKGKNDHELHTQREAMYQLAHIIHSSWKNNCLSDGIT